MLADDERVEELLRPGASALPAYAPNGGSILNFARTTFAIDRLLELGVATDVKDRWGSTPIESMSRLGPRGQPLVRHLIARGVPAAPEEYARLGDRQTLAAMFEQDPAIVRSDAVVMGAVDFGHLELVEWLLARGGERQRSRDCAVAAHRAALGRLERRFADGAPARRRRAPTCPRVTRSTTARRSDGPRPRST